MDIRPLESLNLEGVTISAQINADGTLSPVEGSFNKLLGAANDKALPRIQPEMMVIPAGAQKGGLGTPALRVVEPQNAGVEINRPLEIRNLQVNMTDVDPGVDPLIHASSSRRQAVWRKPLHLS